VSPRGGERAIIVDDERLARDALRALLAAHPEVVLVGEADSVAAAADLVTRLKPDLVFLDIQMPGQSGFELFERVDAVFRTIFVTAYDDFALRAFEVNALDYLLKPVSRARLAAAIDRLFQPSKTSDEAVRMLEPDDHLFVTTERWSGFVRVGDIVFVKAMGQYSEIVTAAGRKAMVLKSMKEWEERLPRRLFTRVHRSAIINITCVERVEKSFNYSFDVHLTGVKDPVAVSRRYAAKLKDHFA
jgi:two-component system, LytTR family, response regulator